MGVPEALNLPTFSSWRSSRSGSSLGLGPALGAAGGAGALGKNGGRALAPSVGLESIFPGGVHSLAGLSDGCPFSVNVLRSPGPSMQAPTCVCVCVYLCAHGCTQLRCSVVLCVFVHVCTHVGLRVCGGVCASLTVSPAVWPQLCASAGVSAPVSAPAPPASASPCVSVYLCARESLRVWVDAAF